MPSTLSQPTGPRRLLARLRDLMAGEGTAEDKLGRLVGVIASDMVAEVCSVYVRRAGDVLELFATQGLKRAAVHLTRLRLGEGLIGTIAAHARPMRLSEASLHPAFAYRPETGEELFHSFLGVPILRGGRVMGVLAVQNKASREYTDEEVESLETVAMVLAELVAGGELVSRDETRPVDGIAMLPLRLDGMRLSGGIGMGQAVLHAPHVEIHRLVAEDPESELQRLRQAVADMHGDLDSKLAGSAGEHRDILEAYRMIAADAGWLTRIEEAVDSGLTAEAAVQKVQNDVRARMSQVADPYLRERVHDFDDLANRLLQHLAGSLQTVAGLPPEADVILIARSLGPAELLDYEGAKLRGVVLEEGSPTAHATIIARAMGLPIIGRVRGILDRVEDGDPMILDADHGQVFVRPGEDVRVAFKDTLRARSRRLAELATLRDKPAVSTDGIAITLNMNAGLLADLAHLDETGVDGVGLYRTEVPFMARSALPDVAAQTVLYRKVLDLAGGRPVVFRTLDVGGDKLLPYWAGEKEENPAMGWRAVRMSLDRPALLRQQLRALIRAAAGRELRIMFPMITEVAEFGAARQLVDMELERERRLGGELPSTLKVGLMLEVPALLFQLPALLPRADFLSVGSNDLFQFLFAADRGNVRLSDRYDPISPAGLDFFRTLVAGCDAARVPVSLCGEMASEPIDAMMLIGLGFRSLSLSSTAVAPVKQMICSLDIGSLHEFLESLRTLSEHSFRGRLRNYARDHGVHL